MSQSAQVQRRYTELYVELSAELYLAITLCEHNGSCCRKYLQYHNCNLLHVTAHKSQPTDPQFRSMSHAIAIVASGMARGPSQSLPFIILQCAVA